MAAEDPTAAPSSVLADVPRGLPPLARAVALSRRAAAEGFDWRCADDVGPVVRSEVDELLETLGKGQPHRIEEEFGDLLFALANLARHLGVQPETALSGTCERFTARFEQVEEHVRRSGRPMREHDLEELDAYWDRAKVELAEAGEATCSRS